MDPLFVSDRICHGSCYTLFTFDWIINDCLIFYSCLIVYARVVAILYSCLIRLFVLVSYFLI
jgi:hypothetical protein